MDKNILLEAKNISKSFPGVKALDQVDFQVRKGTIHGLCGENGAGKSTLMNILMGVYQRDSGELYYKGEIINFKHPKEALDIGISIVEQELTPIPEMTVSENIYLGRESVQNGVINYKKMNENASKILNDLDVNINPSDKMKDLSLAEIQLVEIAKAISYDSDVIIFDEPTSALGEEETEEFFNIIKLLKEEGKGIIYITHRMREIFKLVDEVTVLRNGKYIGTKKIENISHEELVTMMIDRQLEGQYIKENIKKEDTLLKVNNLTVKDKFQDISVDVKNGEIVGIFGLTGSGRSEFLHGIFGSLKIDSGEIFIKDRKVNIKSPKSGIKNQIALITEDRKKSGLVLTSSVKENISISSLEELSNYYVINEKKEKNKVQDMIDKFNIKTPGINQLVKNLSGGNQQKVVLGRWLLTTPDILLLDEPTRGIDVGSKREIYKFMSEFANDNGGIIMVSSEISEILNMTDKIIIFNEGKCVKTISSDKLTEDELMSLAS